jgi:hypothetical protein
MATYNWQLWDNFTAAAEELGLELRSTDGGCVYIGVPEEIREKFYVMCWTPLNQLPHIQRKAERKSPLGDFEIKNLIDNLRQNHGDFHLEFGAKLRSDGSMFWFPNLSIGCPTPSKDDIVRAVKIMMDTENFERNRMLALLREPADEYEEAAE